MISDEAAIALKRYFKKDAEIMQIIDTPDQIEADLEATEKCLMEVKAAALLDLNVSNLP